MFEFIQQIFDTNGFTPRWVCGPAWSDPLRWTHIVSDIAIWTAYVAIPLGLFYSRKVRQGVPMNRMLILFCLFILFCGFNHLLEAIIFWSPIYRFSAVMKLSTAFISLLTAFVLVKDVPTIVPSLDLVKTNQELSKLNQELTSLNERLKAEVAEKTAAQKSLQKTESLFRHTFEEAAIGIAHLDIDGNYIRVNPKFADILERPSDQIVGESFVDFVYQEDLPKALERRSMLIENQGSSYTSEKRMIRPDGSIVWVSHTLALVRDDNKNPDFMVSTVEGISKTREMEAELRATSDKLKDTVSELEAFVYSVSHDLRQPLRSMSGFAQVLIEDHSDQLDPEGKKCAERIVNSSNRMAVLIDALLNISQISRRQLENKSVNLSELALEVLADLKEAQPRENVIINVDPHLETVGDPGLLRSVMQNLLENAWKFTSKTEHPKIKFQLFEGSGGASKSQTFVVRDNGAGFDMEHAAKLFTPFNRLHHADEFAGTGIGLATVSRIIHRHGGRVWVESEVNKGASFYFTLPKKESNNNE